LRDKSLYYDRAEVINMVRNLLSLMTRQPDFSHAVTVYRYLYAIKVALTIIR